MLIILFFPSNDSHNYLSCKNQTDTSALPINPISPDLPYPCAHIHIPYVGTLLDYPQPTNSLCFLFPLSSSSSHVIPLSIASHTLFSLLYITSPFLPCTFSTFSTFSNISQSRSCSNSYIEYPLTSCGDSHDKQNTSNRQCNRPTSGFPCSCRLSSRVNDFPHHPYLYTKRRVDTKSGLMSTKRQRRLVKSLKRLTM